MTIGQKGIRAGTRIPLELPVQIRWKSQAGSEQIAKGITANISGNGLYFFASVCLQHDTPVNIRVTFPVEITHVPIELVCEGRVICQRRTDLSAGIVVIIDDYSLAAMERAV